VTVIENKHWGLFGRRARRYVNGLSANRAGTLAQRQAKGCPEPGTTTGTGKRNALRHGLTLCEFKLALQPKGEPIPQIGRAPSGTRTLSVSDSTGYSL
jgi:hypothetical protein